MKKNILLIGAMLAVLAASALASAEEGISDKLILIGQTVGLTGTVAGPVQEMNAGANAYFNLVNKKGGVFGRKIELLTMDDQFDPALAAANAENLIRKRHVFALFQGRGTPHTLAILPLLATYKVPLIAPSTGALALRQPVNHWVFHIRADYKDEVSKIIEQFTTIGIKAIGIVHVDDSFGQDGLAGFNQALALHKLTPAVVAQFSRAKPDYAAAVNTIMQANPQGLIIVSSSNQTIELIKALRAAGSRTQIMTLSNNSSESFIRDLGVASKGVIISQVMPSPNLVTTGLGDEFMKVAKASGTTVSYAAMEGYVNAKVLVEGLRRAGPNPTREGLVTALESIKHLDLGGIVITYDEKDHSANKFVELTIIGQGGRFIK
ncbi:MULTISPECIES: ABC transporter substrate-binding protein [unclassified Undibacterium]|uniref:ABC transporter substrate-binding protein n=2 Tax=Pseudomonadota TaxID=1224 RepID=UPI002AC99717|nr:MULTISPECIES: ABC transporter substrate-binding protein [unclassified Undibacterium]MEB0141197.1 ABC transporter substrate-binding protein [Undibacterium sp. CCC2.1]MEB0174243.1 ABC transporter substrate-binding protein [Undibacterium sp. CCC1.1]MEB0178186.1 ABC transporter substrate-binding protein [Undibacterium sp. CCC3.4]MEB0217392.1 ABC transporter substrate-binding protein [Undibacterium sp. 5I2]WPX44007.1 ABC transporter substrate-binding protein [Undibacterium sp. CCC3.4]